MARADFCVVFFRDQICFSDIKFQISFSDIFFFRYQFYFRYQNETFFQIFFFSDIRTKFSFSDIRSAISFFRYQNHFFKILAHLVLRSGDKLDIFLLFILRWMTSLGQNCVKWEIKKRDLNCIFLTFNILLESKINISLCTDLIVTDHLFIKVNIRTIY